MKKVLLSEVPAGSLFRESYGTVFRKVTLDTNVGSKNPGYFGTHGKDGSKVTWVSETNDFVELLNSDGTEIVEVVWFTEIKPGEMFKSGSSILAKSRCGQYGVSGNTVVRFSSFSTVVRV